MAETFDYYDPAGLSAPFYDVVAQFDPTLQGELAFYEGLIPEGAWVLELGCGTGRIGLPLAERNRAVVGLDIAPAMLTRGELKRQRLAPEVIQRTAFLAGDMTTFNLNHQFDAVIAPFFGVSHLAAGAPRRSLFERIAAHLAPGGVAALHAILPSALANPGPLDPDKAVLDVEYEPNGGRLRLYVPAQSYDPATGRFEQMLDYVVISPSGEEVRRSRERLVYYASDLEADAAGSGLILSEKITPFNTVGEMWVFKKA